MKPQQNYGMYKNMLPPSASDLSEALIPRIKGKAPQQISNLRSRYGGGAASIVE